MFFYLDCHPLFISCRLGKLACVFKPTANELFSQRNGFWHAVRLFGYSFLWQWKN